MLNVKNFVKGSVKGSNIYIPPLTWKPNSNNSQWRTDQHYSTIAVGGY